jgi:hypothetical protein
MGILTNSLFLLKLFFRSLGHGRGQCWRWGNLPQIIYVLKEALLSSQNAKEVLLDSVFD